MDIKRKIELASSGITSIATHEDEDAAVRKAALDRVITVAEQAKAEIDERVAAQIAEQIDPAS